MDVIQLISAAGIGGVIGSLLTTVVSAWLSNKQYISNRNFQEKKEAFIGLLEAYRAACLNSDEETKNQFAYWSVRCALVTPIEIREMIEDMKISNFERQNDVFNKLQEAMRKDLKVDLSN